MAANERIGRAIEASGGLQIVPMELQYSTIALMRQLNSSEARLRDNNTSRQPRHLDSMHVSLNINDGAARENSELVEILCPTNAAEIRKVLGLPQGPFVDLASFSPYDPLTLSSDDIEDEDHM